ncbi:hypothetical protein KFL_001320030 [Klebsormidium nitens]|uniref:Apple domain-containing protein n=1 Tax=Klebsormidium nitens TaxID=105231 RepID=A0A1Y1HWI0_KLENI|nr:hypothetical protein KFL_001320030 [Klebsormidium nitens]|eukprot:GAQ82995.1 hypothetical protein KFL_001320030 [Klebsormidium nitens]
MFDSLASYSGYLGVLLVVMLFLTALAATQACTPECENCHPYSKYWADQGCDPANSHRVLRVQMHSTAVFQDCCKHCRDVDCCLFWVFNPDTKECEGFSNCDRVDGRTTQREWLGDWRVLDKNCPGYTAHPDAQISYPGF